MGRLRQQILDRAEQFGDRMRDLAAAVERRRVSRPLLDQMCAAGTSVGANTFEADQAVSVADFCKSLGCVTEELSESRHCIRLCRRRGWVAPARLASLEAESVELGRIFSAMVVKSRRSPA